MFDIYLTQSPSCSIQYVTCVFDVRYSRERMAPAGFLHTNVLTHHYLPPNNLPGNKTHEKQTSILTEKCFTAVQLLYYCVVILHAGWGKWVYSMFTCTAAIQLPICWCPVSFKLFLPNTVFHVFGSWYQQSGLQVTVFSVRDCMKLVKQISGWDKYVQMCLNTI